MAKLLLSLTLLVTMPVIGEFLFGRIPSLSFDLPPRAPLLPHPAFSWGVFVILGCSSALGVGAIGRGISRVRLVWKRAVGKFPWWGTLGMGLLGAGWVVSWRGVIVQEELHRHAFVILWTGYVLLVYALLEWRTGSSRFSRRPWFFLRIAAWSVLVWWCFEWLNRYVKNWHYTGIGEISEWHYVLGASLAFATVLPAIAATHDLLRAVLVIETEPKSGDNCSSSPPSPWIRVGGGAGGTIALLLLPEYPDTLFPAVWIAPLGILTALWWQGARTPVVGSGFTGDVAPVVLWSSAGMWCGILWELWNFGSATRWSYTIPYVDAFRVFEMPLLGYAGYLPFGVWCGQIIEILFRESYETRRLRSEGRLVTGLDLLM